MRGIGITESGGPEVLGVYELPEVHPGPGEVRVRIRAVCVNPVDTIMRTNTRSDAIDQCPAPFILGMDLAGYIDEIGPDSVTNLDVGDAVIAMVLPTQNSGAYRESIVLPVNSVSLAPKNASLVEASTLAMNGLTARQSLDQLGLRAGQTIGVTGAAGCYGGYVVQLAKSEGLRVVADASDKDEKLVSDLGADIVVPRGDDISEQIRNVMPEGVDGLADGAVQNHLAVGAVRDGGRFVSVRHWDGADEGRVEFHITSVRDYFHRADLLNKLCRQAEEGILTLRVAATFPPEEAAEAHRRLEAGGTRGRFVIVF
jgi:NADPH:quinone reductase-like Zn-dependent oxidoreductase